MIWRHLFGYLPANVIQGLVSFGAVYAYTRLLGADDYGRYALILTIMSASHTTTLTWAEAAAYRFAGEAEERGGMNDHIRTSITLSMLSLIPALLIVGIGWLIVGGDPKMQAAIIWLALSMPCFSVIQMSLEIHKARQQVSRFAKISIAHILLGFAGGLYFAWRTQAGAAAPFIGLAISGVLFAAIQGQYLWKLSKEGRFETSRAKSYFAYGMPLALALLLEIALGAGDRFLIAYFLDNAAVGAYAAGYGVSDQTIRLLCMWGAMAGAPLLMASYEKHGMSGIAEPGKNMARLLMLIALPAATGLAMVAQPLAQFMIGEELRDQAALTIPWIAAAGLINGFIIYYFSEAFQLSKKTALRASLMIIPTVLNVILNIILLPRIGLMGAVYATVFCYALALLLVMGVGRRFIALPIPIKDLTLIAIACAGMAGVVYLLPAIGAFPELMLKASLGGIAYAILAIGLNAGGARDLVKSLKRSNSA
ncbi:lipopolysaccharide biosynthesis protein [Hirschia litorea]|uniref:Lipopolysaccharide biosynthesis protein n=1 Tax=Hirschia litorea TaxID=1199156 RepID=A0ABW2IMS6_9PROT